MITRLDDHKDPDVVWSILMWERGKLAFDVGANIGQSTRVLADGFEKVVAFEPCRESFEILQAEMPDNVLPLELAVSAQDGDLTLQETSRSITTGQLTTGTGLHWGEVVGERTIPALSLDTVVEQFGHPDFVKIDTEGHEVAIVAGGPKLFERGVKALIEIHQGKNEGLIRNLLPGYEFTKMEHAHLREQSPIRRNHFWLLAEPTVTTFD